MFLFSEFSKSANNSNNGQPTTVSHKDYTKTIANVASINENDAVDNSNFNVKYLTLTTDNINTAVNCDDSNSNNSSGKGSTTSVEGKYSKNHITKVNSVVNSGSTSSLGSSNKKDKDNDKTLKFETNHQHHHLTFNSITQRFSNLGFGNTSNNCSNNSEKCEKVGKISKRSIISLGGKSNNSNNIHSSSNNNNVQQSNAPSINHQVNVDQPISTSSSSSGGGASISNTITSIMTSSLTKNKRNDVNGTGGSCTSIISSYDPMKLIGTPACPRFDDCPVLEPLVCKKIAHERLTALIFREDCFLTACQDGFVYTWARPGYMVSIKPSYYNM